MPWGTLGARWPRGSIPPWYPGKACRSRDHRAVHSKAAGLSGQAWDSRGPGGAGVTSGAPEGVLVPTEARAFHVDEGQPVRSERWSRRSWGPLWSWGSSCPNPRIPLLPFGAHVAWRSWEALRPCVAGPSVFTGTSLLTIPTRGALLPRLPWGSTGSLRPGHRLCVGDPHCRAIGASGALRAWLLILPLRASLLRAAAWVLGATVPQGDLNAARLGLSFYCRHSNFFPHFFCSGVFTVVVSGQGWGRDWGHLREAGFWGALVLTARRRTFLRATARVPRRPIVVSVVPLVLQTELGGHTGVPAHSQFGNCPLELVRVGCSCLSHEETSASLQLQAVGVAGQRQTLHLLAVHEERGPRPAHAQRQAHPATREGGQAEGRSHAGGRGAGLRVEKLHVLVALGHSTQLDAHDHHGLRGVGDGEDHARSLRVGPQPQQQREVREEAGGEVCARRLPAAGVRPEEEGRAHIGVVHVRHLRRQGLPEELQQPHLSARRVWGPHGRH